MNLYLIGHDYRYAAEQMLLTLFPDERPVYPDGRPTGDRAELRLMSGAKVTTATCVLVYQGRTANGRTSVPNEELTDPNETDRRLQGAVKSRETDCFFLSNADTLQAQPDRLAEHGAGLAAQRAEAHHGDACSNQQNLHNGFLCTKHPDHSLLFAP